MNRKYDYELKLRSESEMEQLIKEYKKACEQNRDMCAMYYLGKPDNSHIKYPDKLYVVRTEKATGEKTSADISDCTYRTIYPLLTTYSIGKEEREELNKYLDLYTTYEELELYLREAQKENIPASTIADIFTSLTKYRTVKEIADFNAIETRGEKANVDDYIKTANKCCKHEKIMSNSKK